MQLYSVLRFGASGCRALGLEPHQAHQSPFQSYYLGDCQN